MHLALACDLVLAAEEGDVHLGVHAAGDRSRRGWRVPPAGGRSDHSEQRSSSSSGTTFPPATPKHLGLVNRVVPRSELPALTDEWAARLVAGPTRAYAAAKYLTNRSLESDRATAFWDEAIAQESW